MEEKKKTKNDDQSLVNLWDSNKWCNMCVIGVLLWSGQIMAEKLFIFNQNYKSTDPIRATNPRQETYKINHIKARHNQIVESQ